MVYLIVTLPVLLRTEIAGPIVTTSIIEYRPAGGSETAEVWIQIGSRVLDAVNPLPDGSPAPVVGAWVRLEDAGGAPIQVTHTGSDGGFTFSQLQPGSYILRVRVPGHDEVRRTIDVPSSTNNYDVILS